MIPICRAVDGAVLGVDLRSGDARGCVMSWIADGGFGSTDWNSVDAMLTDVADQLETSLPGHPAMREEGVLTWL